MDRKALIREYKERRAMIGVFQVRNLVSGKVLIGTSTEEKLAPFDDRGYNRRQGR